MSNKIEAAKARAEASFKKPYDGASLGPLQTAHAAEQQAVIEKKARLKAMRLAKEETERGTTVKP